MDALKKSVADGKKSVASAISAKGVSTAADASFAVMTENITTMANNQYNNGYKAGEVTGYKIGSVNTSGYDVTSHRVNLPVAANSAYVQFGYIEPKQSNSSQYIPVNISYSLSGSSLTINFSKTTQFSATVFYLYR